MKQSVRRHIQPSKDSGTAPALQPIPARDAPLQKAPKPPKSPSELNAERSANAILRFNEAERLAATPPIDFCTSVLQPLEAKRIREAALAELEPGPLLKAAGEAIPAFGSTEADDLRASLVNTLEQPSTIGARASEQRLQLAERVDVLQMAVDTAQTAKVGNSVEKMLCHQMAAAHAIAMRLLAYVPANDAGPASRDSFRYVPPVDLARLGNTAARLMEVYQSGCQVLQKLKTGRTQRVVVQHQQLAVSPNGPAVVVNNEPSKRGRRRQGRRRHKK